MRRATPFAIVLTALAVTFTPLYGQNLADQIRSIRDGVVRLSFDTRTEICGDGRSIGEQTADGFVTHTFWSGGYSIQSYEFWQPDCRTGPMRLVVEKQSGAVKELRVAVGVEWMRDARGTDLGTFPGPTVADWLLELASLNEHVGNVAFLAANAARDAIIADHIMSMARDGDLDDDIRKRSMRWVNRAAEREGKGAEADRLFRSIVLASSNHRDVRDRAIRSLRVSDQNDDWLREQYAELNVTELRIRVIRRIGQSPTGQNAEWVQSIVLNSKERVELRDRALRVLGDDLERVDEILGLYPQLDRVELKDRVLRIVGETGTVEALRWMRRVAGDADEPLKVRDRAIRLLGEDADITALKSLYADLTRRELKNRVLRLAGEHDSDAARAWLREIALDQREAHDLRDRALRLLGEYDGVSVRDLFDDLESNELRERVLRIASDRNEAGIAAWLRVVATDPEYATDLRDRALRSLAEHAIRTIELAALYDEVSETDLRRRVIRILAERDDDVATEKLRRIVDTDPNSELRRYAARRLAEMQ